MNTMSSNADSAKNSNELKKNTTLSSEKLDDLVENEN